MYSNFSQYGEGLKALFKKVFNGDVVLEQVDIAFEYAFKNTGGKLKFPFISLYPNSNIIIDKKNVAFPSYKEGMQFQNPMPTFNKNGEYKGTNERLAKNAKFIYIIIGYQIEVWGTDRLSTEQLMQELLFWLMENQEVEITYQGKNLTYSFDVDDQIIDNSDLSLYHSEGKIYRYTLGIQVHATLLRSENYFTVLHPSVDVIPTYKIKEEK